MIYINFPFNKPSGGGSSFLKRLKNNLIQKDLYSNIFKSQIIIFNSHHNIFSTIIYKILFKKKYFLHRVDGPMSLYIGKLDKRDKLVKQINKISDLTVFQSKWSKENNQELFKNCKFFRIIHNGSSINNIKSNITSKKKIIIASWSNNLNKGFNLFKFLDNEVDFTKFDIDFYGNTPFNFTNIRCMGILNTNDLVKKLKSYNLAVVASKNDPCSNFLIECINQNLDVLALNSGGHTELISNKQCLFHSKDELIRKINSYISGRYINKKKYDIDFVSNEYVNVSSYLIDQNLRNNNVNFKKLINIILDIILIKINYK